MVEVQLVPDDVDEVPIGVVVRLCVVPCDAVVDEEEELPLVVDVRLVDVPGSYCVVPIVSCLSVT